MSGAGHYIRAKLVVLGRDPGFSLQATSRRKPNGVYPANEHGIPIRLTDADYISGRILDIQCSHAQRMSRAVLGTTSARNCHDFSNLLIT